MALTYGLGLRDALIKQRVEEHLNLKVFMTRDTDHNVSGADRAHKARDNGADIINVIHFNASGNHRARGTLEVYRDTNNVHQEEDTVLSSDIIDRIVNPPFGEGANHRERVLYLDQDGNQNGPAVSSDLNNGNTQNYHPIRTAYIEVEFIDYGANTPNDATDDIVDILFNTGPNSAAVKTSIVNSIRDGIINNLRIYGATSN